MKLILPKYFPRTQEQSPILGWSIGIDLELKLENTPFLGFLAGVMKLEVFEAELDFLTGMKVVLLIEIFNSGDFENF